MYSLILKTENQSIIFFKHEIRHKFETLHSFFMLSKRVSLV